MPAVQTTALRVGGVRLAALRVTGPGSPVLLLHGVTNGSEGYRPVLEHLAGRHDALAVDLRGHGGSDRGDSYELADYVGDVVELIETTFEGPVTLAGHSLGGMVAAAVAARHPGLVRGLLVEDPPYFTLREPARNEAAPWYPGFGQIRALLERADADDAEFLAGVGELSAQLPDTTIRVADLLPESEIARYATILRGCDPRVLEPILDSRFLAGFPPQELERIACPAVLVAGNPSYGGAMTADDVAAWEARVPHTRTTTLEDAGHLIHHFEPSRETYLAELDRLVNRPADRSVGFPARYPRPETHEGEDMADFEQLIYEESDGVARITLNRPQIRNALSMQLSDELIRAFALVQASTTVKTLVLRGAGGTFSSGDDINELPKWGDANEVVRRVRLYQAMADSLADLDKVTVAAVQGHAVGGGLELTMACDFVIAEESAIWGMPEVDVGITPGWGGTTRMARLIGLRRTKEINLLGALHPARRAAELNLWNRVVADGELDAAVDELLEVLASKNHQAVRQIKYITDRGSETDLHTAQAFEALSAGLTAAVNGNWEVEDADKGAGVDNFLAHAELWERRRGLARDLWVD